MQITINPKGIETDSEEAIDKGYWDSIQSVPQNSCSQYGNYCAACNNVSCTLCGNSYAISSDNGTCVNCSVGCESCSNGKCTKCYDGYRLSNGRCISCSTYSTYCYECNETGCIRCGDWLTLTAEGTCVRCDELYGAHCKSCDNTGCKACFGGYQLINGSCSSQCPVYGLLCNTCDDNGCTSCGKDSGRILINHACVMCSEVGATNCMECTLEGICKRCYGEYGIRGSDPKKCTKCSSNCINCNATGCTKCYSTYNLVNGKCVAR